MWFSKGLDDNNGSCHTRDVAAAWRMKSFKVTWHHLDSCWIAYELYLGKRCGGMYSSSSSTVAFLTVY